MTISVPEYCRNESEYIADIMINSFLGLPYEIVANPFDQFSIEYRGRSVVMPALFFSLCEQHGWLTPQTLPTQPLEIWDTDKLELNAALVQSTIPIIYGKPGYKIKDNTISLNFDLLGSAFFMLSRYEEVVKKDCDCHDRFPATASIAYQESFIDRPLVNEYLEILWACFKYLWPDLRRESRKFQMRVSCDVDQPYQCGIKNPFRQVRHVFGDLIKRKQPIHAIRSSVNYFASKLGDFSFDVYYTNLDWIMDVNEDAGNEVAFYFMAGQTDKEKDGCYSLDEPAIRQLMYRIHNRGHQIGLHPSYSTYKDKGQLKKEANNLRRAMEEESIYQDFIGSRQHYLRWQTPTTAIGCEYAELDYDSTLSFAEQPGFRCGVCYEYPLFDLISRKQLNLVERPLVLMEVSLLAPFYQNISDEIIFLDKVKSLVDTVRSYNGSFILLWHNSNFEKKWYKSAYRKIINL